MLRPAGNREIFIFFAKAHQIFSGIVPGILPSAGW
jgi:hypothetical protein